VSNQEQLQEITTLLEAAGAGREGAMDEVFKTVYPRLRQLAHSKRRGWQGNDTLGTTALINEAYMKVAASESSAFQNRGHFFAIAAQAMRQVLINYAEKMGSAKRGGGAAHVTLHDSDLVGDQALEELLTLNGALESLEKMSPRQARVVECLFFGGYTVEETAEALESSPATVKRDWATARAWLYREIQKGEPDPAAG
jgi:RNA polymerase sigma factor (TIGR02999 family)